MQENIIWILYQIMFWKMYTLALKGKLIRNLCENVIVCILPFFSFSMRTLINMSSPLGLQIGNPLSIPHLHHKSKHKKHKYID